LETAFVALIALIAGTICQYDDDFYHTALSFLHEQVIKQLDEYRGVRDMEALPMPTTAIN
jgi:hypothetical protein